MFAHTRKVVGLVWLTVEEDTGAYIEKCVKFDLSEPETLPLGTWPDVIARLITTAPVETAHPENCRLTSAEEFTARRMLRQASA